MKILASALLALALGAGAGAADTPRFTIVDGDTLWFTEQITVLGSRVPAALPGTTRPVAVLDPDDGAPARSTAELLATLPAVEVNQRQHYGVQGDLGVRGSTFEQVQVLLDGWDVGDAQTGHHNLDLPLAPGDVSRLEVLRGHGSALYGANAFGGVVNVVPRTPSMRRGGELSLGGGDFGTRSARVRVDSGEGPAFGMQGRAWVSGEWFETDGDRVGADAETGSAALRALAEAGAIELDLLAGWSAREFGALDFYAPFPSFEQTETAFAGLKLRADLAEGVTLESRLAGRRHRDRFTLLRDDPELYYNDHVTRRAAAETRLLVEIGPGVSLVAGLEGQYDDIRGEGLRGGVAGPALGDHERRRAAGSLEISGRHAPLRWTLGARLDGWSFLSPRLSRSAAASLDLAAGVVLRASAGTVYRVPTFTELYYEDPANEGSPDLVPERGWSWDAGLEVRRGPWTVGTEVFVRHERDLIDWARPLSAPDEPWRVLNIAAGEVRGLTQTWRLDTPRGHAVFLHGTVLDKSRDLPVDHVAKYDLLAPRRLVAAGAVLRLERRLRLTPLVRLRERSDGAGLAVVDLGADLVLAPWRLRVDVTNLLDREYEEIPGVPLPGRLATASLRYRF